MVLQTFIDSSSIDDLFTRDRLEQNGMTNAQRLYIFSTLLPKVGLKEFEDYICLGNPLSKKTRTLVFHRRGIEKFLTFLKTREQRNYHSKWNVATTALVEKTLDSKAFCQALFVPTLLKEQGVSDTEFFLKKRRNFKKEAYVYMRDYSEYKKRGINFYNYFTREVLLEKWKKEHEARKAPKDKNEFRPLKKRRHEGLLEFWIRQEAFSPKYDYIEKKFITLLKAKLDKQKVKDYLEILDGKDCLDKWHM